MSIIAKNITKIYGTQKALNNVSFEINTGEVVGLLGPNGAGKSTMMKILTCFIPPTSGEALVCGYDIYNESKLLRTKVGYLPENNPLYHDMYIWEYLEFISGIRKIRKRTKEIIKNIIAITGISDEQYKKIGNLSKGYRQRIGLAQALIHDPEVLILDEPTSGLDPNQLVEMRNLITEIGREKTIMLSTHIMQEVEAVCDRAIIINKGEIVWVVNPQDVLTIGQLFKEGKIRWFDGAKLNGAKLQDTNLEGASFKNADMPRISLFGTHLVNTNFEGANMTHAKLKRAILKKANLKGANLSDAHLDRSDLTDANLSEANLTRASLKNAITNGATFDNAIMEGTIT
jgi:ABC-2 type transport system ATP-binding protein